MNKTLLMFSALTLGTASIGLTAYADDAMSGMDMGAKKVAPQAKPVSLFVTATLNPAAPQTGDNTLDLMVADAAGKPVTGLTLTTSVAMTSMDMGTTHPAVSEAGSGHYTTKVNFSMDGPWRVNVLAPGSKIAVFDFNAGSKTPWKSPQGSIPASAGSSGMAAMKMTGMDDMKTAIVPVLKESGTYIATGNEDWKMQTGFGHNAPMVGMMNQMMVGGSGMEGMKMAPMTMTFDEKNYAKPQASEADSPSPGTTKAGDAMAGMDMGTAKPSAAKADVPAPTASPPAKPDTPPAKPAVSGPVKIMAVTASAPKSGDNSLTISITDVQGKPIAGAKITTSVAMTSMDMGTTHPIVADKGAGQYSATVNFSMAGPWRVQVKVTPPGQKPQIKSFDFTAK
jgi:hypothetical protein